MPHSEILESLIPQYIKGGTLKEAETLHGGLINATYLAHVQSEEEPQKLVLQRVNTAVFNKPELVMGNIQKVTSHLKKVAPGARNLHLRETLDGAHYILDGQGGLWRCFNYLEGCVGYEMVETLSQAYQAGHAFGQFLRQMDGLNPDKLEEIIPYFHHTPNRLIQLEEAVKENKAGRLAVVSRQLEFIDSCKPWVSRLQDLLSSGKIPMRITHNDTKISNVLFNAETDEAVCVIDLDTVMPGSMLYDYGDLVRTSINGVAEDAPEEEVECRLEVFRSLTEGYLSAARGTLYEEEIKHLVFSAKIITLELAMRFLADYLNGDLYFQVTRETQNLERARNQLRLVELIQEHEAEMEKIVLELCEG